MPERRETNAPASVRSDVDEPVLSTSDGSDITRSSFSRLPINNVFQDGHPIGTGGRVLLVMMGLFLLAGFGLSGWLSPDPQGHGTHQQLGLPPCTILLLTGTPCPSCGATTAFAHFVRGEWPSAMRANAAAFVLACVCAVLMPWSWASAARGRLVGIENYERAVLILVLAVTGLFALQWAERLING